jgi:uncharacterized protein (TIGR02996 family)
MRWLTQATDFSMPELLTNEDKGFIRAILDHPEELTTWLAYADYLDDRADPRAVFLRLIVERKQLAAGASHQAIDARLAVLRGELNPNWILVFDTPRVGNCVTRFICRMSWDTLSPTDEPDIRICHECKSPVFYCQTLEEARLFTSCGQRVALNTLAPVEDPSVPLEEAVGDEFDTE